jgi:asparagine synthetase B (glutamine-hydrolysing)
MAMSVSRLEMATGLVFGAAEHPAPLPDPVDGMPLEALEQGILPALLRPPCLVSFSGGRDSSAVLAVATALARREGLELPIPATNAFVDAPAADEVEWQTKLVKLLGLSDWLRVERSDELDVIGPYAQKVMGRHGLLWPCNVHFHLPLIEAGRGGSLLTGIGGDELFLAARRSRFAAIRTRTARPEPRDVPRLAFALAPPVVRRAVIRWREPITFPWIRPAARRAARAANARDTAAEPRQLRERLAWWQTLRYLRVGSASLDLVGRGEQVRITHPLLSPRFWSAVAAEAPLGFASRTEGMRRLFGAHLPNEALARSSKAHFDEAFWTSRAREFARTWPGSGLPDEFVDPVALRRHWHEPQPLAQSFGLLQAAWLHSEPSAAARSDDERGPSAYGLLTRPHPGSIVQA